MYGIEWKIFQAQAQDLQGTNFVKVWHVIVCDTHFLYRRSPISMNFWYLGCRTNWGIVLNGDNISTKTREIGNFDFQSPFFLTFDDFSVQN